MKSIKKISVLVLLLVSAFIFTACDDSGDSDGNNSGENEILREYKIGDTGPSGVGIVFYVTDNGTHGLEAAPGNQSTNISWASAAGKARAYSGGGKTDWFLPSKDELVELYSQRDTVGGFIDDAYWSSSEAGSTHAWVVFFPSGTLRDNWKTASRCVRAIRAF
jgi:hypothetical protein